MKTRFISVIFLALTAMLFASCASDTATTTTTTETRTDRTKSSMYAR